MFGKERIEQLETDLAELRQQLEDERQARVTAQTEANARINTVATQVQHAEELAVVASGEVDGVKENLQEFAGAFNRQSAVIAKFIGGVHAVTSHFVGSGPAAVPVVNPPRRQSAPPQGNPAGVSNLPRNQRRKIERSQRRQGPGGTPEARAQ